METHLRKFPIFALCEKKKNNNFTAFPRSIETVGGGSTFLSASTQNLMRHIKSPPYLSRLLLWKAAHMMKHCFNFVLLESLKPIFMEAWMTWKHLNALTESASI